MNKLTYIPIKRAFRIISIIVLLLFALPFANAAGRMDSAITKFANSKAMRNAKIGICVIDLKTGKTAAAYNSNNALIPASVTKLITSATAIKALTPGYRFKTDVYVDGRIDRNGVVNGNVIVNAGIDPTLESRFFPDQESFIVKVVKSLQSKGIKRIEGKVIINEKACPEPGVPEDWDDSDVVEDYGSGVHAINYSDNLCSLIFDVSGSKAIIIDTLPHQKKLKIRNNVKVVRGKSGRWTPAATRRKNSDLLIVSGNVRRQNNLVELKTTTPDPADALSCDLTEAIVCEGITVRNKNLKGKGYTPICSYYSPRLEEIASSLLFRSDNMYAEAVLRAIGLQNNFSSSRLSALKKEKSIISTWGIDIAGQTIYDGSGLSRTNRYSAKFLAGILAKAATDHQIGNIFPTLLPVCGYEGTVRNLLKGTSLEGRMALKSGSMTGVQCYAGYYPTGRPQYAVVMMANNFRCNYGTLKHSIEQLFIDMFA